MRRLYHFHELPHKEKLKFFTQEVLDDFQTVRKTLVIMMLITIVIEAIIRFFFFPLLQNNEQDSRFISNSFLFVGSIFTYLLTLLKVFHNKIVWRSRLRFILYLVSSILYCVYIFNSVFYSIEEAFQKDLTDCWGFAIISVLNCIHVASIIFLISPTWYFKALVIGSCHVAVIACFWKINSSIKGWVMMKCLANLFYLVSYILLASHFRWKLFLKNSETQGRTQVYNEILDRMSSLIVIINSSSEIIYSNLPFKSRVGQDSRTFFSSITNLKIRDLSERPGTLDPLINFSAEDGSLHDNRENVTGNCTGPGLLKTLDSIPSRFNTLQELIDSYISFLTKSDIKNDDQIIYDAKMQKVSLTQNVTLSYEVTLRPLFEQKNIIVILNNTTQRDLIASLEDNNQYKDKLLASVSHELRTPLNGNIGFLQAAIEEVAIPQTVKDKLLVPALRSGKMLCHLINDILDYSKMQTERIKLFYEYRSLRESLNYCYNLLEHAFKAKKLDFNLSIDPSVPLLFCTDHERLNQVILNLLSNALKFTWKGGVRLEASTSETPNVLKITVSDTGTGISNENLAKLFYDHPISKKTDDECSNQSKGVGLGLKVANMLAKILSPNRERGLQVQSVVGTGSSFTFEVLNNKPNRKKTQEIQRKLSPIAEKKGISLPEVPDELRFDEIVVSRKFQILMLSQSSKAISNPQFIKHKEAIMNNLEKVQVLLVDDDLINIMALQFLFEAFKIQTEVAYNGKEAIDKIINQPFRYKLILMDCQMPIMDGFEASKELTSMMKNGDIPSIPIIGCTAFSGKDKLEECINCGMSEVILKPIIRDKLRETLVRYLNIDL